VQSKTIGLIGGIGWASTLEYYRLINEAVVARMGPSHSAKIILISLNQFDFTSRAAQGTSHAIAEFLIAEGTRLKAAGADFFLLCANGAHRFVPAVVPQIGLPFISIVEETAKQVRLSGIKRVGLLGVKQTMSGNFYHTSLAKVGVETLIPDPEDQEIVHQIIYAELVHNRVTETSREIFVKIINKLVQEGAEAIILGCTEIPLLIRQQDVGVPVFNTTEIHCDAAVKCAFGAQRCTDSEHG
jgi:aspartate racemase